MFQMTSFPNVLRGVQSIISSRRLLATLSMKVASIYRSGIVNVNECSLGLWLLPARHRSISRAISTPISSVRKLDQPCKTPSKAAAHLGNSSRNNHPSIQVYFPPPGARLYSAAQYHTPAGYVFIPLCRRVIAASDLTMLFCI
ncbi:hypothetical protein XELAEV_18003890mg [Xenopus laevis]|uniref:Uncharacterized protein n=1 Tax=Xenopus laevis TaxID=8355 RepID=A0A974BPP1_XENLA|nr:hypothetical protein XELAEV_18003890mg [Xenopus laevis]